MIAQRRRSGRLEKEPHEGQMPTSTTAQGISVVFFFGTLYLQSIESFLFCYFEIPGVHTS